MRLLESVDLPNGVVELISLLVATSWNKNPITCVIRAVKKL